MAALEKSFPQGARKLQSKLSIRGSNGAYVCTCAVRRRVRQREESERDTKSKRDHCAAGRIDTQQDTLRSWLVTDGGPPHTRRARLQSLHALDKALVPLSIV